MGIPSGHKKKNNNKEGEEGQKEAYTDIPLRRPGSPEEAARAIVGVASPWFSYVNGETIEVTGGRNI